MIEVKGLEAIEVKLKKLQDIGTNTKPLMQTLGNILQNEVEDAFENETSPFGERWKPLSAITAFSYHGGGGIKNLTKGRQASFIKSGKRQSKPFLNKFGAGGSKKILRDTGALADRWITKADKNKVSVSNNVQFHFFKYGLTHQFGTNNAFGRGIKIPARPFLPVDKSGRLPDKTKRAIEDATIEFITERLK